MEEAETPLPSEETTPPVTKTYFVRSLAFDPVIPCFCVRTRRVVAEYDAYAKKNARVKLLEKRQEKRMFT